jgi:hypothetical protein
LEKPSHRKQSHRATTQPDYFQNKKSEISFAQFTDIMNEEYFYKTFLEPMSPKDFLLVGLTEHYSDFVEKLSGILSIEMTSDTRLREGNKESLSQKDIEHAQSALS